MSDLRISPPYTARVSNLRLVLLLLFALLVGAIALLIRGDTLRLFLLSVAVTTLVMVVMFGLSAVYSRVRLARSDATLKILFANDPGPALITNRDGWVLWRNAAASSQLGVGDGVLVSAALSALIDNRDTVDRLQRTALDDGTAVEQLNGSRISVAKAGTNRLIWRYFLQDDAVGRRGMNLTVRTDENDNILWMSPALLELFDDPPTHVDDLLDCGEHGSGAIPTLQLPNGTRPARTTKRPIRNGLIELEITLDSTNSIDDGLFESLPVPLLELDRAGIVRRSNRQARRMLTLDPSETAPLHTLVEGLGRQIGDWLAEGFDGRLRGRPEVVRASRSKGDLFLQVTLQQGMDNAPDRIVAVLQDATELKTLEAQFVQSQKMQAIGQLAGGVAHDFNNLLTAISGHCDLLLLRHDPTDSDYADLEQINQNASRAASLVGQLLAFSRKQNLSPERLDLRDILADLTHLLNRLVGCRVSLSFSHDPTLQMVRADKRQLEQVIMNLVVNARDAMPEGGPIRVITRMLHLDAPERHDRVEVPAGAYVVVEVHDRGIGIPSGKLEKIFEPFFTTKKLGEGTGLGLSTAYGIVKQTGGYIFAGPAPDQGTVFSLYFPAVARECIVSKDTVPARNSFARKRQGRILLVEDEPPVRAFAARALRLRGYDVIEAEDGETALEIVGAAGTDFDVFVSDVIMPGLDGPGWVRKALERHPGTNVIFVSGYAEESFAENQATIPNSRFLPKPFSLKDLTQAVDDEIG